MCEELLFFYCVRLNLLPDRVSHYMYFKIEYMKRMTMMLVVSFCMTLAMSAQNRNREDMMEKRAETLANELGLKDDAKTAFKTQYAAYQQELFNARMAGIDLEKVQKEDSENLSDDEIKARIQQQFDREAQQIVNAYNVLNVEKKYYEEFSKTLTPSQLLKIFVPEKSESNRRPNMGQSENGSGRSQRAPRGNRGANFGNSGFGDDPFGGE